MKFWTLFICCAVGALVSCSRQNSDPVAAAAKPTPVKLATAQVESRSFERLIPATGSLYPDETMTISSETGGRVESVNFDYGQFVPKGAVVAEIDKREHQLQLQRTRATLAQALARIGLKPGQENIQPSETPQIRQARAQYEDTLSKYESAKKLHASGDISLDRFRELEKALDGRRATLDASGHDLNTQLASIAALKAEVALVEKRIADATLHSPFDATVQERMASPGQFVKDNTPILRLVKSWPVRLRIDVPEPNAGFVKLGTHVRFTTDALPGSQFTAAITELSPALDMRSRSLNAEARITSFDKRLRPGMFAHVLLAPGKSDAPAVPEQAVLSVAGLKKVFLVRNGSVKELRVRLGQAADGWVEIPDGELKPGDLVATDMLAALTDGAAVEVVR